MPTSRRYKELRQPPDADRRVRTRRTLGTFVAHGGDKMWDHLYNVDGIRVARWTVERLMRNMGLSGVRRGRSWIRTTISDGGAVEVLLVEDTTDTGCRSKAVSGKVRHSIFVTLDED